MTKTLGLLATLGALALTGLVVAQNLPQSAQIPPPAPAPGPAPSPASGGGEKRIALVIGNSGYQAGALKTPANDAGLISQTLQAAGFDVVGARDLDQELVRHSIRDFLDKAQSSGSGAVAFIYLSGYGLQVEGENYFVPIDAKLTQATDVPAEAVRLSDLMQPLAALKLKAGILVLDAARPNPFVKSGPPLAGGLALVDAEPGMLIAFNAAPGTVAPEGEGPYGAYAQALAEMIREGGLQPTEVFDRVRLRVNEMTKGAEVPWQSANIKLPFVFFERAPDAPPPTVSAQQSRELRARPIRDLGAQDAYAAVLERDTLQDYTDFLAAYPDDLMAARVRAIAAARREAITWSRTRIADTPDAYWSYVRRYPRGPHAPDARRRLVFLSAALEPPPSFRMLAYDVPPPPPNEIVFVERPVLVFSDPVFAFAPPPPPPVIFLAPRAAFWIALPPPPPPIGLFILPTPVYQPVPAWVRPPAYVAPPPPNNIIYNNVHNTVIINNTTNDVTIKTPSGQTTTQPIAVAARAPGAPAAAPGSTAPTVGPALPPSVASRASTTQGAGSQGSATPGAPVTGGQVPTQASRQPVGQPLPGAKGQQPLPSTPAVSPSTGTPAGQPTTAARGQPSTPGTPSTTAQPGQAHALPVPGAKGQPPAPGIAPTANIPAGQTSSPHGQPAALGTAPATVSPPAGQAHPSPQAPAAVRQTAPGTLPTANVPAGSPSAPSRVQPVAPGSVPTANLPAGQGQKLPAPGTKGKPAPGTPSAATQPTGAQSAPAHGQPAVGNTSPANSPAGQASPGAQGPASAPGTPSTATQPTGTQSAPVHGQPAVGSTPPTNSPGGQAKGQTSARGTTPPANSPPGQVQRKKPGASQVAGQPAGQSSAPAAGAVGR